MTQQPNHRDRASSLGSLHRGLAAGGAVRFLAVEARGLGNEISSRHGLNGGATRLAAECAVASLFMSAYVKGNERLTLQVQAERPRFAFHGDVDVSGGVRARFSPIGVVRPQGGKLSGVMLATKATRDREVYRGITAMQGQSIQEALRDHLSDSSQVHAVLRMAAGLDDDGTVRFAGGVLVERLPDAAGHASLDPEAFLAMFEPLQHRKVGDILVELAFGKLVGSPIELLESRQVRWHCGCEQRIEPMLRQLGVAELQSMLEEDGGAEVICHFCNVPNRIDANGLRRLIDEGRAPAAE